VLLCYLLSDRKGIWPVKICKVFELGVEAIPLELGEYYYLHNGPAGLVATAESISCFAKSGTDIILCWYRLIQVHLET